MQVARAPLGGATSIVIFLGTCVFVLVSTVGVSVVDAHDPVAQLETPSSATKVNPEPKSASTSTSSSNVLLKEERRTRASQARRNTVVEFLGEHFPELQVSLLKSEERSPIRFRNAISRLESDIIRLQNIEQKRPAKFELMVDQWKLKTQAEMTIARYAKKESDSELEARLSPLLDQMLDIRKTIFELDRQSAVNRLSNIDKRLLLLDDNRARIIENNLRSFQKSADKIRAKKKRKSARRQSLKSNPDTDSQPSVESP